VIKQTAKQIVKQIAQEPLEILKSVREQVSPTEQVPEQETTRETKPNESTPEEKAKKTAQEGRLMQAYEGEIEEIRRQELFKDLQRRISEGEDVPLEDFAGLRPEEKQVLEAQKQAVAARKAQGVGAQKETIPQIIGKRGRKMFGKVGLKREQTKVEMRQPPSS
jgi:hypothetical protein